MKRETKQCNLCGKTKFKFMFKKDKYSIIRCKSCNLVTVSPFPTQKELDKLYKQEYFEKGKISMNHVFKNPDVNLRGGKSKFKFSIFKWIKVYIQGILCYLSLKTKVNNYTIGSNLEVYTKKIK